MDRSMSRDRRSEGSSRHGREKNQDKKKKRRRSPSSSSSSSSSSSTSRSPSPIHSKKASQKSKDVKTIKKRRKRGSSTSSSSSSTSSSSSSSSSSNDKKAKRKKSKAKKRKLKKKKAKLKKERKKEKRRERKLKKVEKMKVEKKVEKRAEVPALPNPPAEKPPLFLEMWQSDEGTAELGPVMTDEQKARLATKRPITKEEYEARQSVIRRVVDPETGLTRLVRGEGEIIEEIVSREKHKDIKQAKGDGNAFQKKMGINR